MAKSKSKSTKTKSGKLEKSKISKSEKTKKSGKSAKSIGSDSAPTSEEAIRSQKSSPKSSKIAVSGSVVVSQQKSTFIKVPKEVRQTTAYGFGYENISPIDASTFKSSIHEDSRRYINISSAPQEEQSVRKATASKQSSIAATKSTKSSGTCKVVTALITFGMLCVIIGNILLVFFILENTWNSLSKFVYIFKKIYLYLIIDMSQNSVIFSY